MFQVSALLFDSKWEKKRGERTIVLIHSAALSPVVVPDKELPHVPNNKRKSGCCCACRHLYTWLYNIGSLTMHDKQGKKMHPVEVVVGEAVITWPGDGRCRHTIADVDEPSKKRQLFTFGVLCVRLLPTTRTETQMAGIIVLLKERQSNLFLHVSWPVEYRKSQNSFD